MRTYLIRSFVTQAKAQRSLQYSEHRQLSVASNLYHRSFVSFRFHSLPRCQWQLDKCGQWAEVQTCHAVGGRIEQINFVVVTRLIGECARRGAWRHTRRWLRNANHDRRASYGEDKGGCLAMEMEMGPAPFLRNQEYPLFSIEI